MHLGKGREHGLKRALQVTAGALVIGLGLPALVLSVRPRQKPTEREETVQGETAETQEPQEPSMGDGQCTLQVLMEDGRVSQMALDEYLTGVLLAEIPASFSPEAVKAQAVVSRTYTLRRLEHSKHQEADICTDPGCCQGWQDPKAYEGGQAGIEVMETAIRETDGEVLTYEGALIDATFFSCSGGRTEAAVEVWGTNVPYLQSVDSPGEEAPHNEDTELFSAEDFADRILADAPEADLSGAPETWFGSVQETEGGGVASLEIGGVFFTGTELRRILGLRSTIFQIGVWDGSIQVQTQGFGHRVGMSQYGAEAMAGEGSTYQEILYHYYTGVSLEQFFSE